MTADELIAAAADPRGPRSDQWFDRLERDEDALEAALTGEQGLAVAAAVWPFWLNRSRVPQGREWLERLLAEPGARTDARAEALHGAGTLAFIQGDRAAAEPRMREALEIADEVGDEELSAEARVGHARCALLAGDIDAMRKHAEESVEVARRAGSARAEALALHHVVEARRRQGELDAVVPLYHESIALQRRLGSERGVALELHNLGNVERMRGNLDGATDFLRESLEIYARHRAPTIAYCFLGLGNVASARGDHERAARLIAIADARFEESGRALDPDYHADRERSIAAARQALGPVYDELVRDARALSLDDAVAYALA